MKLKPRRFLLVASAISAAVLGVRAEAQTLVGVNSLSISGLTLSASLALQESAGPSPRSAVTFGAFGLGAFDWKDDPASGRDSGKPAGWSKGDDPAFRRFTAPERLFGGVELRVGRTVHSRKWTELLEEAASRYFTDGCPGSRDVCEAPAHRRIAAAIAAAANETPRRAVDRVNRAVNSAIRFTDDAQQYGVRDHWAQASETLLSGRGDCEDYAILKFWALAAAGVPQDAMRLVLVRDVRRELDHAVLAVALDGANLVLDSLTNEVRTDAAFHHYEPRLSFASHGEWLFGRQRPQIARVEQSSLVRR